VRIHPLAWGPVALVPALALASPGGHSWKRRILDATCAAVVVTAVVAVVSGGVIWSTLSLMRGGALMKPEAPPLGTALVVLAIAAGTITVTWRRDTRWIVLAAVPHALFLAATAHNFAQSAIWQHSYARIFLTLPFLALVAHTPRRHALVIVGVLALAVAVVGLPVVRARTTEHLEYRWLRTQLQSIPADCYVAHISRAGTRTLYLPVYPPHFPLPFGAGETIDPRLAGPDRCLYYVHGSICTSPEGRTACADFEQRLRLDAKASTTLPAIPSFTPQPYDRSAVECRLARVLGPAARERRPE
jgi:hypothetical protein